jgi:uncharacterized OB-fold protein
MSTAGYDKPVPDLADPLWRGFWEASREHRITAQRCFKCQLLRFPALPMCANCQSLAWEWADVSSRGTVWSYVVYHRAFHPAFAPDVPYIVAVVENVEGLHYTGMIVGGPREEVHVGAKVHAVFEAGTPEFTLLKWAIDE